MQVYPKIINQNFHDWFDGSKGIIEDGSNQPQIFYHKSRSTELFSKFSHDGVVKNEYNDCYGFYFVASHHKTYVDYMGSGLEYYVFLKMKSPFYIHDDGRSNVTDMNGIKYDNLDINKQFCLELEKKGFDSIIILCPFYYNQYIVFNPNQIKSIDNNGDYSLEDDDIFK